MLTMLRGLINHSRRERGQVLILATAFLFLVVAVAAMVVDAGFFLHARRDSQNTADAGALAGAQHLPDDPIGAEDAALAWAAQNGWTDGADGVAVTVTTPYNGSAKSIEVVVAGPARGTHFFSALFDISSRAVAEVVITTSGSGPGDGVGGDTLIPVPQAIPGCVEDHPTVDGRVMPGEGYEKFADLVGGGTSFGEALFACDSGYYYFAMRLNGPDTGGTVANENVYACKAGKTGDVQINGDDTIKKLKGSITSVGFSSFTMNAAGETWTVNVNGSTTFEVDKQKGMTIDDLAAFMEVDVKGSVTGPQTALATKVKAKNVAGGCGASFSSTYHADFDTGWVQSPKGKHTWKELLGSDRARFQIACGTTPVYDFVQDYLREDGSGWASDANPVGNGETIVAAPPDSASSLEFNLENPTVTGWGDDPGEDPLIQSPPFDGSYPNYDSEYDGWIWEMIYEFRVPKSAFTACGGAINFALPSFDGQRGPVGGIHSSPSKVLEGGSVFLESTIEILLVE